MKPKSILIFGGGLNQLTLIKACNDLGYQSVVIDPGSNPPGKGLAHEFEIVEADNYEKTKLIAWKYQVDGIATSQMENPLRMMSKLASELGFHFNAPEVIERSLNKHLMKEAFISKGVPHAKGIFFTNKDQLTRETLKDIAFPLIIKPVDSHSSRGVYKVGSFDQIINYIDETISFSKSGNFLIEEFVDGNEYSIETVTFNGETTVIQITEKMLTPLPNVVELGHLQPASLNEQEKEKIAVIVSEGIKALGLDNTVCHTELMLNSKGPVIIEIGPRMGGDFISSYLVKHSCGVNLDEATIQMSVGKKPDLKTTTRQFSFIKYLQLETGKKVKSTGSWEKILDLPDVVFANVSIKEGEIVPRITDSAKRPGFVIVEGKSREHVITLAEKYLLVMKNEIILS